MSKQREVMLDRLPEADPRINPDTLSRDSGMLSDRGPYEQYASISSTTSV